ncbi:hypothetical protein BDZ97DRAFT_258211 [Flammula alnicola]|nr:hypothetical protein BDZ97DRAFT_258211 [Flammula alnicola]
MNRRHHPVTQSHHPSHCRPTFSLFYDFFVFTYTRLSCASLTNPVNSAFISGKFPCAFLSPLFNKLPPRLASTFTHPHPVLSFLLHPLPSSPYICISTATASATNVAGRPCPTSFDISAEFMVIPYRPLRVSIPDRCLYHQLTNCIKLIIAYYHYLALSNPLQRIGLLWH